MRKGRKQIKYQDLLQIIESTDDTQSRGRAIYGLVNRGGADGARVLIDIFPLLMWRETKFQIIDALSSVDDFRVTEFLINMSRNELDLPLAREACFALGNSPSLSGHLYLLNIAKDISRVLYREALFSLSNNFLHSDFNFLSGILQSYTTEALSAQMPCIISALGASGNTAMYPHIESFLNVETYEHSPELLFSAIIAAGKTGGQEARSHLDKLHRIHDIILRDLVGIAKNRINYRQTLNPSQLLNSFFSNVDLTQYHSILTTLREVRSKHLWELFLKQASSSNIEANKATLVRIALYDPEHAESDLAFILDNYDFINTPELVTLVRLHGEANASFLRSFYENAQHDKLKNFAPLLFIQEIFSGYLDGLLKPVENVADHIEKINTLVSWYHIDALSENNVEKLKKGLFQIAKKTDVAVIKERVIRALGQINFNSNEFIDFLSVSVNEPSNHRNSLYLTLKQINTPEATEVLVYQLKLALESPDSEEKVQDILWYLSQLGEGSINNADFLALLNFELAHKNAESVLKILTNATCLNLCEFIEDYLYSSDFNYKLLAIAAAKHNMSPSIAEVLAEYSIDKDFIISERSLDTLSKSHKKFSHKILFDLLETENLDKRRKLKVLRAIEPESDKNYNDLNEQITKFIQEEEDEDIVDGLMNLRNRFDFNKQVLSVSPNASGGAVRSADQDIDIDLASFFPSYLSFPETTQSALRNTEIVFKYPDIFHNRVDKSTILVEYVKAIDILLHTHLGPVLFYENSKNSLTKMQSRIYLFGFDNPRQLPRNIARILQCEEYFPQNKFPIFKLSQISQDILTGRICNQQFQTVDGLRAWALILLLFFRHMEVNHRKVEPLIKLPGISPRNICLIAARMNELQSLRNDAAHRGMMLEIADLINIREKSFSLIRDIVQVCQKALASSSEKQKKAS